MNVFQRLITPEQHPTSLDITPCQICMDPLRWYDIYGGGPHCASCKPVVLSLFEKKEMISLDSFGRFQIELTLNDGEWEEFEIDGRLIIQRKGYWPKTYDDPFPENTPSDNPISSPAR